MSQTIYDADYYERGIESGKSCYQSYRWIPELTIPMAMTIIDYLGIKKGQRVLDFGCAKGFLVKALRLLYRDAYGIDSSEYAIINCDPTVDDYCYLSSWFPKDLEFDFCIAKDVFEHVPEDDLPAVLDSINAKKMFAVIPLGDGSGFYAPANNMDVTHVTCATSEWWVKAFEENGWEIETVSMHVPGIKDSYYQLYPDAHGFFVLQNKKQQGIHKP